MTQYTKGPWKITHAGRADNGACHKHQIGTSEKTVAYTWKPITHDRGESFHEHNANAALIAAAPDLLEALILAEAQIESFYTATMTSVKSRDENRSLKKLALENVRAAIAKAEGR